MDSSSDRTHRPRTATTTNTSSELFIGFSSRHSSSSYMKFSSKPSILSPARARDPSISLSTSRSRRLRTSGSIKNGQASPMFPAEGRKRGGGFENPEPSSPKVTCIGQVRDKTKKKGKKIQTLTRRRSAEVSFRITEHTRHDQIRRQCSVNSQYQQHQEFSSHRNQKWVHLPLTICETLRGFGSEFSCLFPCKPSCFSESSEREKREEKVGGEGNDGGQSPCGAPFGRWLVAVQDDGEGGKGRDIEVVVGGADEEEGERPIRSARRHVFDEIEINDDIFKGNDHEGNDMEGGEGRVSICIPPKNALLLMRCRSDPVKMEALANRFWEPQLPKQEEEDDEETERDNDEDNNRNKEEAASVEMVEVKDEVEMVQKENLKQVLEEGRKSVSVDINEEEEENQPEAKEFLEMEVQDNEEDKTIEDLQNNKALQDGDQEKQEETKKEALVEEENELDFATLFEALADEESEEDDENDPMKYKNEDESRVSYSNASFSLQSDQEISEPEEEDEEELAGEVALELEYSMESTVEKETQDKTLEVKLVEKVTREEEEEEGIRKTEERETESNAVEERESEAELKKKEERESSSRLPDSLLLMMCEPKLSMEVSKETWVCSTDFIRWKPPVLVKQTDGGDDHAEDDETAEKMVSVDSNSIKSYYQPLLQLPRLSCCLPATEAAVPMATMIEQKLVSAVAYEPFVLTRCKSAPMRTASKKLAPDACFWKNRTLEPHRRGTFGIGAAEVGF